MQVNLVPTNVASFYLYNLVEIIAEMLDIFQKTEYDLKVRHF